MSTKQATAKKASKSHRRVATGQWKDRRSSKTSRFVSSSKGVVSPAELLAVAVHSGSVKEAAKVLRVGKAAARVADLNSKRSKAVRDEEYENTGFVEI